jgi:hypothetical protein
MKFCGLLIYNFNDAHTCQSHMQLLGMLVKLLFLMFHEIVLFKLFGFYFLSIYLLFIYLL